MPKSLCRLLATGTLLALAACGEGRASLQNETGAAAPEKVPGDLVHYVRASTDPYPRNGYCQSGTCTWFETRSQQVVGSSDHERQVRVTLATGRSSHPDSGYPADASRAPVRWSDEEEAYVFCSRWRPAVRRQRGREWEQARVDLIGGMGDFEESTKSIYGLVCHLEDDWTAEGFFERRGYRPQAGQPVTRIAQPQENTYIYPHDPERPEMGGMAVSHSPPARPVTVTLDTPMPTTAIDARPMADRAAHFELFEGGLGEQLRSIAGPFATAAECERARAARPRTDWPRTHCIAGERRTIP